MKIKLLLLFIFATSIYANDFYKEVSINRVTANGTTDIGSTYGASIKAGKYINDNLRVYLDTTVSKWGNADLISVGINLDHIININAKHDFYYGVDIDRIKHKTEVTDNNTEYENAYGLKIGLIRKNILKDFDLNIGINYKKLDVTTHNDNNTYQYKLNSIVIFYAGIAF